MRRHRIDPDPDARWRRLRLRGRLIWVVPLTAALAAGVLEAASWGRRGLEHMAPDDRDLGVFLAIVLAGCGYAAVWLLAVDYARRPTQRKIALEWTALAVAYATARVAIPLTADGVGPATRALLGALGAGILGCAALVLVLWCLDRPPFMSPPPQRLSDGSWV